MSFEGEIGEIDLIQRLVELGSEQFTGAIRFESDGIIKIVYFKGGDVLSAIIRAMVRFSEAATDRDPSNVRRVREILGGYAPRIFRRIALHALARCPEAAPDSIIANVHLRHRPA